MTSSNLTPTAMQTSQLIEATTESVTGTAQLPTGSSLGAIPAQPAGATSAAPGLLPPFAPFPLGPLAPGLQPGAFLPCGATTCTGVWTFRANGEVTVRCRSSLIRASSRVTVTASEYAGVWTNRFIGLADVEVLNVAPFEGGMDIKVLIHWGSPIEIALSAVISF